MVGRVCIFTQQHCKAPCTITDAFANPSTDHPPHSGLVSKANNSTWMQEWSKSTPSCCAVLCCAAQFDPSEQQQQQQQEEEQEEESAAISCGSERVSRPCLTLFFGARLPVRLDVASLAPCTHAGVLQQQELTSWQPYAHAGVWQQQVLTSHAATP
jgi:hypothetical protein